MPFLYIDESGDPGPLIPGHPYQPSPHYILSGAAIQASEWRNLLTTMWKSTKKRACKLLLFS